MDLMSLILSCSFASIDDTLVASIAYQESHYAAFYVRPYGGLQGIQYPDKDRALQAIARLRGSYEGVYVGVMGVPLDRASQYESDPETLLDPCHNIAVATAILADQKEECARQESGDPMSCTLRAYGQLTGFDGDYFAEHVLFDGLIAEPGEQAIDGADGNTNSISFEVNESGVSSNTLFFDVDLQRLNETSTNQVANDLED
jgi:hypothetical protein